MCFWSVCTIDGTGFITFEFIFKEEKRGRFWLKRRRFVMWNMAFCMHVLIVKRLNDSTIKQNIKV